MFLLNLEYNIVYKSLKGSSVTTKETRDATLLVRLVRSKSSMYSIEELKNNYLDDELRNHMRMIITFKYLAVINC